MNKIKNKSIISTISLLLTLPFCLVSCNESGSEVNSDETIYLHVLNSEDYIDENVLTIFEEQNPGVKVIYETFDTNENMYNELKTGKANYDLINCSEYMVQRLASEGLIQKVKGLETYLENVSPYLVNKDYLNSDVINNSYKTGTNENTTYTPGKIDTINVTDAKTGDYLGRLSEYAIGYMWGTLGIVYNPTYSTFVDRGMSKERISEELNSDNGWSKFWDKDYKGVMSIKDSMRDTYALGILEVYKEDFLKKEELSQEERNEIFNRHDSDTIEKVKNKLIELKDNIFGFEVDSGKNDIVTGKIGMNLAWSGDATFSILQGEYYPGDDESYEEQKPDGERTELYYALPSIGANIWFDAWCMPLTVDLNSRNYEYACKFLNFLSETNTQTDDYDEEIGGIVEANMSYTGYTSFISGANNEIFDYVVENYDVGGGSNTLDLSYFYHNNPSCVIEDIDPSSFEGRTLKAMYPEESQIDSLYVMQDFGEDNDKIVQMWEDVKVNPLPVFVVVLLVVILVGILGYLGTYKLVHKYKIKKRKELRAKLMN